MYKNLMHVSDWFPTLLDMVDVKYVSRLGYELDGVSHYGAWSSMSGRTLTDRTQKDRSLDGRSLDSSVVMAAPRTSMLYNAATNVDKQDFDYSTNAPFAVRNERYKLIHFFNSTGDPPVRSYHMSYHIIFTIFITNFNSTP